MQGAAKVGRAGHNRQSFRGTAFPLRRTGPCSARTQLPARLPEKPRGEALQRSWAPGPGPPPRSPRSFLHIFHDPYDPYSPYPCCVPAEAPAAHSCHKYLHFELALWAVLVACQGRTQRS